MSCLRREADVSRPRITRPSVARPFSSHSSAVRRRTALERHSPVRLSKDLSSFSPAWTGEALSEQRFPVPGDREAPRPFAPPARRPRTVLPPRVPRQLELRLLAKLWRAGAAGKV